MKWINLIYDDEYNDVDIICVPDTVANNIKNVVRQFHIWIADEKNVHNYWTTSKLGFKTLLIDTEAFIWWLNDHYSRTGELAYIVEQHVTFRKELDSAEF